MRRMVSLGVGFLLAVSASNVAAQQPGTLGAPRTRASAAPNPTAGAPASRTAPKTTPGALPPRSSNLLPGTRPNVFTTIQGNALTSTNGALPNGIIRLRDARYGRIVEVTTTDSSGLFAFRSVDPGSYIVELMASDQVTILAASQILNVNSGEALSAIVKLPFRVPPFAGLLGHATTLSSVAALSGVLATTVTGEPVSPQR